MIKRSKRIVAVAGLAALMNCSPEGITGPDIDEELPLGAAEIRPFLAVPPGEPAVGVPFVVTFSVKRGPDAPTVGSFAAVIQYDATAVQFVSADLPADAVLVVHEARPGTLAVAGASAQGFAANALVSATVKLLKAGGLGSMTSTVSELTSSELEDKTPASSRPVVRHPFRDR